MQNPRSCSLVLLALTLLTFSPARADDPPPPASSASLNNQGLQQKQTQAETIRMARRLEGMLRVLSYHQVDASIEQKIMDEAAGVLKGLSQKQMKEIFEQLESSAKSPSPVEADKHLDVAYGKHREVLDRFRQLMLQFESVRNLEHAAQKFDKLAKEQTDLRERVLLADQQRRESERIRRGMRPESPTHQAMKQDDIARDTDALLHKLNDLRGDVPEELKPRVEKTINLAQERRLLETMRDAANHIKYRNAREAEDRQIQANFDLERLARTLRAPVEKLAALQEARDRVQKLIKDQETLRQQAQTYQDQKKLKQNEGKPNQVIQEALKMATRQMELLVQTRDTKDLVQPHAAQVAEKLTGVDATMQEAKDRLREILPLKSIDPQTKSTKQLEETKSLLDQLVAEEEKRQRDPLVGLEKAIAQLEKLIAEQNLAQQKAQDAVKAERPQDLKNQATKQQNLAFNAEEIAQKPMAARPEAKDLIQGAAEAMHAASEQLHAQQGPPAIANQDRALADLAKARDALKADAKEIAQRREQIAQMQEAGKKLDELHKEEQSIAQSAKEQSDKTSPDTQKTNEQLAQKQQSTKGQTSALSKELEKLAPQAAEKTKQSTPTMQQAAEALQKQQAKQGSERAERAAQQLAEAKDALSEALAQKMAEEAAAEAMQNPDKVMPGEAAVHVAKALMETKEAAKQSGQAAQQGEQGKQAMAKSQSATQSAQSAIDQARALSPQNVMPPLNNARGELDQAKKNLQQNTPQSAQQSQEKAASELNQALQSLQQTMAAMEKMQGNQQTAQQDGKQGQQGQQGQKQAKGQKSQQQKGEQTAQNDADDKQKQGDPNQAGERDGNAKSEKGDVKGGSTFVNLPARQRELIMQALSEKLPPEHAAQIKRYFENIAGGKAATEDKKKDK